MPILNGYHVNWTAPAKAKSKKQMPTSLRTFEGRLKVHDLELLTTIASIASWKKWYGHIHLFCDEPAREYYQSLDILHLWDSVDVELLNTMPEYVRPDIFWAASKLWVQKHLDLPYTIVDTDAYFVGKEQAFFDGFDLVASHEDKATLSNEHLLCKDPNENTKTRYPQPKCYLLPSSSMYNADFLSVKPINVGCLYINNKILRDKYIKTALEMMRECKLDVLDEYYLITSVEQHLLSYIANQLNCKRAFCRDAIYASMLRSNLGKFDFWVDRKTDQRLPANLAENAPVYIGLFRHLWFSKVLFGLDESFELLAYQNIIADFQQFFPEYLTLPLVKSVREKYEPRLQGRDVLAEIVANYPQ